MVGRSAEIALAAGRSFDPSEMDTVKVRTRACLNCGKPSLLSLNREQVEAWQKGMLIQEAFPELSKEEREVLKTGIHPKCWKELFPPEEE